MISLCLSDQSKIKISTRNNGLNTSLTDYGYTIDMSC